MMTKRARVGLAIAGVASVGLLFPAVALAEDSAPATATESTAPSGDTPNPREERREARKDRMEERQEELAAALAKELGVSEDKVKAALEKIRSERQQEHKEEREKRLSERLEKAVSEGKITQEQADAILKAAESGVLPGGPGGGPGRAHG
ncbi:hypothetical protein [Streptomyces marianii]|uniref:hypothetical protein n=1 Tax=Streptomyces marianii TaxID=1817406 RepID=UPI001F1A1C41|nr:hypothetical protein [Streptomyces marianii]